jgi:hypothetical protein
MSFMYPRLISVTRPDTTSGVGAIGYQGLLPTNETTVVTDVPANIQRMENTRALAADLPGDVARGSMWAIFFKLPNGTVLDRDIITDDLNVRYQVAAAYWNSMGYKAICERLQT